MLYKIERYGNKYKLVIYKTAIHSARKMDMQKFLSNDEKDLKEKAISKSACNVSRAKSRVQELALCNDWEYFVTLTISAEKQDRYALKEYIKALGNWISNYNKKYNCKMKYLLVPECHKDGAWHLHGLFSGIASESLVVNEYGYFDMPYYKNRFGFISFDKIRNKEKCSTYISKYILKQYEDTLINSVEVGSHLFYASRGLKGKEFIESGCVDYSIINDIWNNDYVGICWCDSFDKLEKVINNYSMEWGEDDVI